MESSSKVVIVFVSLLATGLIAAVVGYAIWRFRRTLDSLIPDLPKQVREAQARLDRISAEEMANRKAHDEQRARFSTNADQRYWSRWDFEQRQKQFIKYSWLIDATIARMNGERHAMDEGQAKIAGAIGLLDAMREVTADLQYPFGAGAEQRIQKAIDCYMAIPSLIKSAPEHFEDLFGYPPTPPELAKLLQIDIAALKHLKLKRGSELSQSTQTQSSRDEMFSSLLKVFGKSLATEEESRDFTSQQLQRKSESSVSRGQTPAELKR